MCKIPFIVVKYTPSKNSKAKQAYTVKKNHMSLKSDEPLKCYGDSTILNKLKLSKSEPGENLADLLGPVGE